MKKLIITIFTLLAFAIPVNATYLPDVQAPKFPGDIWYVDSAMALSGAGLTPGTAFKTVNEADTAASAGDMVIIKAGTYTGTVVIAKSSLTIKCEMGVVFDPASGVALTVSGSYNKIICEDGAFKINPYDTQTGLVVSGSWNYITNSRIPCASTSLIGHEVTGNGNVLTNCRASNSLTAAFKNSGDQNGFDRCFTGGIPADVSIGFWVTSTSDKARLFHCASQGHSTAGFQIDSGATNGEAISCTSGGGDGAKADPGNGFVWSNFRYENHLYKNLTLDANNTTKSYNLYRVYGVVKVMNFYAVVTDTALSANHTNCFVSVDGGTDIPISKNTTLTLSAAPIGSLIVREADATNVMAYTSGVTCFISENSAYRDPTTEVIVGAKGDGTATYIKFTHTTSDAPSSGELDFHIEYVAVSNDGFLVAQ